MELLAIFRAHAPPAAGRAAPALELERALNDLIARSSHAWPQLAVPPDELVRCAARQLPPSVDGPGTPAALAQLHAEDLHLACACALGVPGALEAFDLAFFGPSFARVLSRFDPSAGFVDEVRQSLREKLLVSKSGAPPRIAEYSGRGALANWVRVAALRAAVDLRRRDGEPTAAKQEDDAVATAAAPDLLYLKGRYGKEFQEAVSTAFASLDDEQCNLLRLQHVDGLRTAQIAALFHVDRSTIKRQLASCRAKLLDETQRILRERLGMSPTEFQSVARLVQSQLHLSVERLLRRGR